MFKPVDFSDRGTAYVKHHHKIMGNAKRFTTNTPCPKCGGHQRQYSKGKKDVTTSFCISCHTSKLDKRREIAHTLTVEQRRAIEDHQHRNDEDYFL